MRVWSLNPKYLDRQGLLACWRETLLAQKVLQGQTKGYRHHPQLIRFRLCPDPLAAVGTYLAVLAGEAGQRGYVFDMSKINPSRANFKIPVTRGQVLVEWAHLKEKLERRDPLRLVDYSEIEIPELHPLFILVPGEVEAWERKGGRTAGWV